MKAGNFNGDTVHEAVFSCGESISDFGTFRFSGDLRAHTSDVTVGLNENRREGGISYGGVFDFGVFRFAESVRAGNSGIAVGLLKSEGGC